MFQWFCTTVFIHTSLSMS